MTIKLNGSSSGFVALQAPASAGSNTLTLPTSNGSADQVLTTNGSGGVLSWAAAGGGTIVQVKNATKTDTFTTASTSYADVTGLSISITPTSTSNFILIWAFVNGMTNGSAGYGQIVRDTTAIGIGDAASNRIRASWGMHNAGSGNRAGTFGNTWIEQAQSTSATTYKIQVRHENGSGDIFINRTSNTTDDASCGRYSSSIAVMEFSV